MPTAGETARYVKSIRNPLKREYAKAWLRFLTCGGEEPLDPQGLSYMAAQAVRLNLRELVKP